MSVLDGVNDVQPNIDDDSDDEYIIVERSEAPARKRRALKRGGVPSPASMSTSSMDDAIKEMIEIDKNRSLVVQTRTQQPNTQISRLISSYRASQRGKRAKSSTSQRSQQLTIQNDDEDEELIRVEFDGSKRVKRGRKSQDAESGMDMKEVKLAERLTLDDISEVMVTLSLGPKTESTAKPSRNVGPKCIKVSIDDDLHAIVKQSCAMWKDRGFVLAAPIRTNYPHPFKLSNNDCISSVLNNNPIARCIKNLMQRELCRPPTWWIHKTMPGCSSKTLENILFFCVAFNSAANPMFKLKSTQSTRVQVTRIPMKHIERSQAAAIVANELLLAIIRRQKNMKPMLPYSSHAFNPAAALHFDIATQGVVVRSTSIQCAGMACKIKMISLIDEAKRLARLQTACRISSATRCDKAKLNEICESVLGGVDAQHNDFWSSIALLYFCNSHPITREWVELDSISIGVVESLSRYACVEHTRRSNYVNRLLKECVSKQSIIKVFTDSIAESEQKLTQLRQRQQHELNNTQLREEICMIESDLSQFKQQLTTAQNVVENNQMARRKNGVPEESDERYSARATLGNTPSEVLARWIEILGGSFMNVMCTMSTNADDAEMSTINNIQMQLSRFEAEFERLEEAHTDADEQLTNMLWHMVRRIVSMMHSLVRATSLAPKLINGQLVSVDLDGEPVRVTVDTIESPPVSHQSSWGSNTVSSSLTIRDHAILWSPVSALMPPRNKFELENAPISLLRQFSQLDHQKDRSVLNRVQQEFPQVVANGHARSTLVFHTRIVHDPNVHEQARSFQTSECKAHAPQGCVPFISIGLRAQWIAFKLNIRRRPSLNRLEFGATLKDRVLTDPSMEREHAVPTPLLAVSEFQSEFIGTESYDGVKHDNFAISYSVCANKATRLDDIYNASDPHHMMVHAMALLSAGMTTIGWASQFGMIMCDGVGALLSNGQRVQRRADNTSMLNLTCFCLYVGGRGNIVRTMIGTPWEGCYPSWIDPGVASFGIEARNYSDERNPSSFYISEQTTQQFAKMFTENFLVPINDVECDQRPAPTRGIPFGMIPGVHSALNGYYEALQTIHSHLKLPNTQQCDLFTFPISSFAQQVGCSMGSPEWAPDILPSHVQHEMRCRAWNPDNTDPTLAVAFSDRICTPNQLELSDNLFENGLEEIGSVIAMASYLVVLAEWTSRNVQVEEERPTTMDDKLELFHFVISAHLINRNDTSWKTIEHIQRVKQLNIPQLDSIAARAIVVINAIYPCTHVVGDPLFHPHIAATTTRCVHENKPRYDIDPNACVAINSWWDHFRCNDPAKCAWQTGLKPLLLNLMTHQGTHAMTQSQASAVRASLDAAIVASFWVYSDNGQRAFSEECPLHGLMSPHEIRHEHVDGLFVVRPNSGIDNFGQACGGIVGIKFFQMQQLFVLLEAQGASAPKEMQLYRCGGQMLIRQSSDASEAPTSAAGARKDSERHKRYLCALFERDIDSQGSIEERRKVCLKCREAWDKNVQTFAPTFLHLERPQPAYKRHMGDIAPPFARPPQTEYINETNDYMATVSALSDALRDPNIKHSHEKFMSPNATSL